MMELTPIHKGTIYIVATPIGNLKDITIRALEVIKQVDVLLVEDTRSILELLNFYGIQPNKIMSYHSQNEKERQTQIFSLISSHSIALVSEAGTPLICDPGFLLVNTCLQKKIPLVMIPGVTAFTTLLPLSGFSLKEFLFCGFLSNKKGTRFNQLTQYAHYQMVLVFYESPHRIQGFLEDIVAIFPLDQLMIIGRELTKKFETIYRGTIAHIFDSSRKINFFYKGELTIIINNSK